MKIVTECTPSIKRLLIYYRYRILDRIFWYCSSRNYFKICDYIRKNFYKSLRNTGKLVTVVEYYLEKNEKGEFVIKNKLLWHYKNYGDNDEKEFSGYDSYRL